jgi:hypothetical protein
MRQRFFSTAGCFVLSAVLPFVATAAPPEAADKAPAAAASTGKPATSSPSAPKSGEAQLLEWDALLPEKERDSMRSAPPAPVHDYLGEGAPAMTQTGSADVNTELNGQRVKLPGYLVPLGVNDKGIATEFFLVPYFGACVHVPPPPPNQIVYIKSAKGLALESISDAWWITGTMQTKSKGSRLGMASYSIDAEKIELYTY